jgi:hypothetical protein
VTGPARIIPAPPEVADADEMLSACTNAAGIAWAAAQDADSGLQEALRVYTEKRCAWDVAEQQSSQALRAAESARLAAGVRLTPDGYVALPSVIEQAAAIAAEWQQDADGLAELEKMSTTAQQRDEIAAEAIRRETEQAHEDWSAWRKS